MTAAKPPGVCYSQPGAKGFCCKQQQHNSGHKSKLQFHSGRHSGSCHSQKPTFTDPVIKKSKQSYVCGHKQTSDSTKHTVHTTINSNCKQQLADASISHCCVIQHSSMRRPLMLHLRLLLLPAQCSLIGCCCVAVCQPCHRWCKNRSSIMMPIRVAWQACPIAVTPPTAAAAAGQRCWPHQALPPQPLSHTCPAGRVAAAWAAASPSSWLPAAAADPAHPEQWWAAPAAPGCRCLAAPHLLPQSADRQAVLGQLTWGVGGVWLALWAVSTEGHCRHHHQSPTHCPQVTAAAVVAAGGPGFQTSGLAAVRAVGCQLPPQAAVAAAAPAA